MYKKLIMGSGQFNRVELEDWLQGSRVASSAEILHRAAACSMRGRKMVLTDYYKFEKVAAKSKTRMDCTLSTCSYPVFDDKAATKQRNATDK